MGVVSGGPAEGETLEVNTLILTGGPGGDCCAANRTNSEPRN
jgi:hypothetical protein